MSTNPSNPRRSVESRVFNFSFGSVRTDPIRFSWNYEELDAMLRYRLEFCGELYNDAELFDAENQLTEYHSFNNKQSFRYNFRASALTDRLRIGYNDFPANDTSAVVEWGNLFLSRVVAPMLSFF